jgi:hypothetical protein
MNNKIKLLLYTSIISIFLLVIFSVLKIYHSSVLELESRWLIVASIPLLAGIIFSGQIRRFKGLGVELESNIITEVSPSKKDLSGDKLNELPLPEKDEPNKIPADYIYINHTSFLREEKQKEFQTLTHVQGVPHYDIRVIVDSYYKGALERIKFVKYYLHKSYPEPIQIKYDRLDHFCLKEIANGEYVLVAKVFLKDLENPIILERYITLWTSGPKIT